MSATSRNSEDPVARMCQRCQLAMLHDQEHDGLEQRSEHGKRHLWCKEDSLLFTKFRLVDELPTLPKLDESARTGCDFCSFLRHIILSDDTAEATRQRLNRKGITASLACEVSISTYFIWQGLDDSPASGMDGMVVELSIDGLDEGLSLFCAVEASTESKTVAEWLGLALPSNQSYIDAESVNLIKERIEDCTTTHEHLADDGNFIPERLLLVEGRNLRLVLRSDLARRGMTGSETVPRAPRYAALSYCWGSPSDAEGQLKTTADSLEERRAGISEDELTAVLRDAVHFTRALSIPYLWVDALCILQKDDADWQHQCAEMDKIYGNAHVTLCAAASTNCHEGFLRQRGRRIRLTFQSATATDIKGSFYVQFKYARHNTPTGLFSSDMDDCRWQDRGWTYQEQVLSTRLIVFGNWNLHFSCEETHQSRGRAMVPKSHHLQVYESKLAGMSRTTMYVVWDAVFADFCHHTGSSFTIPTDLLPSLAGIATIFQRQLQDEYAAGHWSGDLFSSLAWMLFFPERKDYHDSITSTQLASTYLIPTWSRIGKGIGLSIYTFANPHSLRSEVTRLIAETRLVGSQPLGAIAHAHLSVTSLAMDLDSFDPKDVHIKKSSHVGVFGSLFLKKQCFGSFSLDFDLPFRAQDMGNEDAGGALQEILRHRWVLLGSCGIKSKTESKEPLAIENQRIRWAFGLVLRQAIDTDQFYRVGSFFPDFLNAEGAGSLELFRKHSKAQTMVVV